MTDQIIVDELNPDKIKEILQKALREYNHDFLGQYKLKPFSIYMKDDLSEIIAGISGFVLSKHSVIRLEYVWVREDFRNKGVGTKLFQRLDGYAAMNQCKRIQVSTMEFQGPSFYEKMGYKRIGTIPKWFCDRDEIFYMKEVPLTND